MVLATVIMNMVYLTSETRCRLGEAGINDPGVKVAVTLFTFFGLWLLQVCEPRAASWPVRDAAPSNFA